MRREMKRILNRHTSLTGFPGRYFYYKTLIPPSVRGKATKSIFQVRGAQRTTSFALESIYVRPPRSF